MPVRLPRGERLRRLIEVATSTLLVIAIVVGLASMLLEAADASETLSPDDHWIDQ